MDIALFVIIGISEIISLCCAVKLWSGGGNVVVKILWSLALVAPVIGPTFYGALYPTPPESIDWSGGFDA